MLPDQNDPQNCPAKRAEEDAEAMFDSLMRERSGFLDGSGGTGAGMDLKWEGQEGLSEIASKDCM